MSRSSDRCTTMARAVRPGVIAVRRREIRTVIPPPPAPRQVQQRTHVATTTTTSPPPTTTAPTTTAESRAALCWQCDYCTYINDQVEFLSCEMCGMIRSNPTKTCAVATTKATGAATTPATTKRSAPVSSVHDDDDYDGWGMFENHHPPFLSSLDPQGRGSPQAVAAPATYEEQAMHMAKLCQDREDEIRQALIRERMQEIVDRQEILCYEILAAKKRQCRQTSPLPDSQNTVSALDDSLQDMLRKELRGSKPHTATTTTTMTSQRRSHDRKPPPLSSSPFTFSPTEGLRS